ncbi:hypothetical protein NMG60_11012576 [Bertholletia excelsa]
MEEKLKQVLQKVESSVKQNWVLDLAYGVENKITKVKNFLNEPNFTKGSNRKALLYNLNNILTEYLVRPKCQVLKDLDKILSDLESDSRHPQTTDTAGSISEASQLYTDQESPAELPQDYRESTREVDRAKVHGFKDKVKTLQWQLVTQNADDSPFRAIGIVGMRGVGKTTLSQLIFCHEEVKNHFLPRLWVCLSEQPKEDEDKRKVIVKRMLTSLGVEEGVIKSIDHGTDDGLKRLLFALRLQLTGKRYLMILDDLWNTEGKMKDFCLDVAEELKCDEKLAYGLPKGRGGAIIVTSRTEEVVKGMVGEGNLKVLEPLKDDKDSIWKIFKESAEENGKKLTKELDSLKERIVDKCAGLPLAAKMLGDIANKQISIVDKCAERPPAAKMLGDIANKQISTAKDQTPPNSRVENSSQYAQGLGKPPTPENQGFEEAVGGEEQEKDDIVD